MSTFRVEIVEIDKVIPHPNADRLSIAEIIGWRCVVGKDEFESGDLALYIPIDSVLPEPVETLLFANSKVQLNNSRVRTIKIRGEISQGMLVSLEKFPQVPRKVGFDAAELLGIGKFQPPAASWEPKEKGANKVKTKKSPNPNFHKYTELEHLKWYPNVFADGEPVVMTEKIHGTNFRAGYVRTEVNSLWKRVKKFLGLLSEYEFVHGSRNVQLHVWENGKGTYYGKDLYRKAADDYKLKDKLMDGEVVYGEVYGTGIQKNYNYGCTNDERRLVIFDVMKDGKYLDHDALFEFCRSRFLPMVPVLYVGPYSKEALDAVTVGDSVLAPEQKIREGCVMRPLAERYENGLGRKILKSINPEFLLRKDNTDFQ